MTADELLRVPRSTPRGDRLYELIAGRLVVRMPRGALAGLVATQIMERLYEHAREAGSGTAFGRVGYHVARDPDTVLAPDASYFPTGRLGGGPMPPGYLPFAPDLAVEVRWPGDRKGAEAARVALLLGAGVRLVWYVEPAERRGAIHAPGAAPEPVGEDGLLDGRDVVPGFACRLRDALDW